VLPIGMHGALEAGIREVVDVLGYGNEVADWVVQDLKKRSFGLQHSGAKIDWDRLLTGERMIEIVKLECELWAAKFER
jgi:hypothetical protein